MKCSVCGHDNPDIAVYCGDCGAKLLEETDCAAPVDADGFESINDDTQLTSAPSAQYTSPYAAPIAPAGDRSKSGMALASLILGCTSICCCCFVFLALPCAVLAVIFGIIGLKSSRKGLAIAGLATGICGLAFAVYLLVFAIMNPVTEQDWQDIFGDIGQYV